MKSSSFLCGVLFGAVATAMARKNKGLLTAAMDAGSMMNWSSMTSQHSSDKREQSSSHSGSKGFSGTQVRPSCNSTNDESYSKEHTLKQIMEFIKGNPEVRSEVEGILKETNTAIPGL